MPADLDWSWALCFLSDLEIVDPSAFTSLAANLGSQAWETLGISTDCVQHTRWLLNAMMDTYNLLPVPSFIATPPV